MDLLSAAARTSGKRWPEADHNVERPVGRCKDNGLGCNRWYSRSGLLAERAMSNETPSSIGVEGVLELSGASREANCAGRELR